MATRREQLLKKADKDQYAKSPRGLAVSAYKKASKNQNMTGMLAAAGGDMTKLKGLHREAFPGSATKKAATFKPPQSFSSKTQKSSAKPSKAVAKPSKAVAKPSKAVAKPPKAVARIAGSTVDQAPRASISGPMTQSRGRLATVGRTGTAKATTGGTTARTRRGTSTAGAVKGVKKLASGVTKAGKSYRSTMDRSDKAISRGVKKASQATKKWARKVSKQGFTF